MRTLIHDLRYSIRTLCRTPGFTGVVIFLLALGIGANTAIFSFVSAVMLKPLPYKDADRLAVPATIFRQLDTDRGSSSMPDVLDWKAQRDLFDAVSAYQGDTFDLTGVGEPERVNGLSVDESYFRVMSAPPLAGRTFSAEENLPENNRVVVISEGLWLRRFGADPKAVGMTVDLSGVPHKIIGVMRKDSVWPGDADIWKPSGFARPPEWTMRRDNHMFETVAKLHPGVSIAQAQARLTVMGERIAREAEHRAGTGWKLHSLHDWIVPPDVRRILAVLLATVGAVLLIACVNVANLLLARGTARAREIAIRAALGAGSRRLMRLFLSESALLAAAGAVAGLAFAAALMRVLLRLTPDGVPRIEGVALDWRVLGFTAAVSVLTALAFGLLPAAHAVRPARPERFREGAHGLGGVHGRKLRSALVISEVALTTVLLIGAGLLVRTFVHMLRIDPGVATENLITMQVSLPHSRYKETAGIAGALDQITDSVRHVPGVLSASAVSALPVSGGGYYLGRVFLATGVPDPPAGKDTFGAWNVAQPGYFRTMGIQVLRGRDFDERDGEKSTPVIIISEGMAREMFPGQDPIGKRIRSWRDENVYREIVGIARDTRYYGLTDKPANTVYVPHRQDAWRTMVLTARTKTDPYALLPSIRGAIRAHDPKLTIAEIRTMDQVLSTALSSVRFTTFLLAVFAGLALTLAAVGIYGVMSYVVARRAHEFGVRMALGAQARDVLRNVLGQGIAITLAGITLGILSAAALTRLLASLVFGVSPRDLATFLAIAGAVTVIALAACLIPARRATRVDPSIALRYE